MKNITLSELQRLVCEELDQRNLKRPSIRKNALTRVCQYIQTCSKNYLHENRLRLPEDKDRFKADYERYKKQYINGKNLSGAESSVINEMYNQLNK